MIGKETSKFIDIVKEHII